MAAEAPQSSLFFNISLCSFYLWSNLLTDFTSLTDSHHVSISTGQETFFTSSTEIDIKDCPATFFGKVYQKLYVSKMNLPVWTAVSLCPRWSFVSGTMLHFYSQTNVLWISSAVCALSGDWLLDAFCVPMSACILQCVFKMFSISFSLRVDVLC